MSAEPARSKRALTSEQWEEVRDLLADAIQLPAGERNAFLDRASQNDTALRAELESLLAAHEIAEGGQFERPAVPTNLRRSFDSLIEQAAELTGRRIGAYQIEAEIGHGGMGKVYRAHRADDRFSMQVAIKFLDRASVSEHALELFRHEREILANLDHPNIARLLDAGESNDGIPYFVMEYVDGQSLTSYCDNQRLTIEHRLSLFLKVCSAVHYAHQHLVIHRDIKPDNILVTQNGEPKLLDFGIAKVNDTSAITRTMTRWLALTPAYASPEQLLGKSLNIATDIYSLGLVLYELLTGRYAYGKHESALELQRAILEQDPLRPSEAIVGSSLDSTERHAALVKIANARQATPQKLRSQLRGDLENVLIKAVRKDPYLRYASTERLAEDIQRYLQGLPVLARHGTVAYSVRKFVSRNRLAVTAGVLALVMATAGMIFVVREARVARTQQMRAERRFNDVRKLAGSLIFEFHDAIQGLPGATPARKLLLERAREYLDSLAIESSGDLPLERDLAAAYERIGQLQGNSLDANTGETQAGIISLQKAADLEDAVAEANRTNIDDQLSAARIHRGLASLMGNSGIAAARGHTERAMAISTRLLQANGSNPKVLVERAAEYDQLAFFEEDTDPAAAAESLKSGLAITETLLNANSNDAKLENRVAIGRVRLGNELATLGLRKQALDFNHAGLELYRSLTKDRTNAKARREMAVTMVFRGGILMQDGNRNAALELFRTALTALEALLKTDPKNVLYQLDVAGANAWVAKAETTSHADRLRRFDRSIAIYEEGFARDHSYTDIPYLLALTRVWKGDALAERNDFRAAVDNYRKGVAGLEDLQGRAVSVARACDLAAIYDGLGRLSAKLGEIQDATRAYEKALQIAEPLATRKPTNILALYAAAEAYFGKGELSRIAAIHARALSIERRQRWTEARDWYRKSTNAWREVTNPGLETPNGIPVTNSAQAIERMRAAEAVLAN